MSHLTVWVLCELNRSVVRALNRRVLAVKVTTRGRITPQPTEAQRLDIHRLLVI